MRRERLVHVEKVWEIKGKRECGKSEGGAVGERWGGKREMLEVNQQFFWGGEEMMWMEKK